MSNSGDLGIGAKGTIVPYLLLYIIYIIRSYIIVCVRRVGAVSGRFNQTTLPPSQQRIQRHRSSKQIALSNIAVELFQQLVLHLSLDPFSHHFHAQLMADFGGFRDVIDTLGGVRVLARNPVTDEAYPVSPGVIRRVHIQAGVHSMTGAQALIFARSRHGSSDFDRAARQQQVITAVRAQSDIKAITANIPALVADLKDALKSDFPQADLPLLLELVGRIDASNVRSVVFTPPIYQREGSDERGYIIVPDVAKIRAAVVAAFAAEPTAEEVQAQSIEREAARIWVLNGTGRPGEASSFAAAIARTGLDAQAPSGVTPNELGLLQTRLIVYNGAEARIPATLAALEKLLDRSAIRIDDPTVTVDAVVITGADLPAIGQ